MNYKTYKNANVSCLGMGNMRLPVKADVEGHPIDYDKATEIIDYAIANGVNYFDTAYIYHGGESEKFLGDALVSRYPRENYYIATKFAYFASPDYKAMFEEQLSRLKTDYVDFYLIHSVQDDSCDNLLECGAIEYFLEQKRLGRIKNLGFSSHASPEKLEKFASHHDWDFAQIQLNYFDWKYGTAKAEYEILHNKNIPIVVMEPVRGGRLAQLTEHSESMLKALHPDWSIAKWAFKFIESLPGIQVVLSGMSNMNQIIDNVNTFSEPQNLTEDEIKTLFEACDAFRSQVQVPCTACRYCCPDCPMQINIPEVLKIYNSYKVNGAHVLGALKNIETAGKPSDCIGCGLCASHCPQSIDVPSIMSELASIVK